MKERERFLKLRKRKIKLTLNTRMTMLVSLIVFISVFIAFGLISVLQWLIPALNSIPLFIQVLIISLVVATIAARILSVLFFVPIKVLRSAMKKVADGDFSTKIDKKATSSEMQEVFAGFNMMTEELSSTEILQTDFVSNVSHEFKTPINAIEGYTTLLQGCEGLDSEQQEYVEKILFNTNRLSTLVSNILLLSKIENQSIQTNREHYDLDEQIREAIVSLEPQWSEKNIDFDVELDDISYYGNESIMHHVWNNLIGNAVKFSPEGGMVKITLKKRNNQYVFVIEDEGPGLSEEAKKHLFDKFYQADTSHKEEGNGLGLSLVKRILAIDGGRIYAQNLEKGCRFTVVLYEYK